MNPMRVLFLSLSRVPLPVIILIILGLAAGVTTVVVSYVHMQEQQVSDIKHKMDVAERGQIYRVVYAVKDIAENATIAADSLEEREGRGIAPLDAVQNAVLAIGRKTKYAIPAGSLVSFHDLALTQSSGFEARLKQGYRAVSLPIDATSGVAGFVGPGSRVDILASVGSGRETTTACILSNVEVIAVGDKTERSGGAGTYQGNTVTVALTPSDTMKLIQAEVSSGKLHLALRNDADHRPVGVVDITALYPRAMRGIEVPTAPPIALEPPPRDLVPVVNEEPKASGHSVEMIAGSKKEVIPVPRI